MLVGAILDLAQNEDLARLGRQGRQRRRDMAAPVAGQRALLRIRTLGRPVFDLFQRPVIGAALGPHVGPGVAHDAQQPGPRLLAAEGVEVAQRPQHGLLRHVLRRHRIARQPA